MNAQRTRAADPCEDSSMSDELVRVFAAPSTFEAQLAKGRLETAGIPVLLKGEGEGPYRMGPAELFVLSTYEPQARLILESFREGAEEGGGDEGDGGEPESG
jgi:Putative prokaryotic signal transducing protein